MENTDQKVIPITQDKIVPDKSVSDDQEGTLLIRVSPSNVGYVDFTENGCHIFPIMAGNNYTFTLPLGEHHITMLSNGYYSVTVTPLIKQNDPCEIDVTLTENARQLIINNMGDDLIIYDGWEKNKILYQGGDEHIQIMVPFGHAVAIESAATRAGEYPPKFVPPIKVDTTLDWPQDAFPNR